jgi:hypothetical protein
MKYGGYMTDKNWWDYSPKEIKNMTNTDKKFKPGEGVFQETTTNPKDIEGKKRVPLHLIPNAGLVHTAMAMQEGANKYQPYNWRDKKVSFSVYVSAAKRHLGKFFDREDLDSESGVHHLGHAAACCMILLDAMASDSFIDDRPRYVNLNKVMRECIDNFNAAHTSARGADETIDKQD